MSVLDSTWQLDISLPVACAWLEFALCLLFSQCSLWIWQQGGRGRGAGMQQTACCNRMWKVDRFVR